MKPLKKSPATGQVLAYVLASHEDDAFLQLNALLEPFGIMQFYRDGWGAYERYIAPVFHTVGKRYAQKIERKHLDVTNTDYTVFI